MVKWGPASQLTTPPWEERDPETLWSSGSTGEGPFSLVSLALGHDGANVPRLIVGSQLPGLNRSGRERTFG